MDKNEVKDMLNKNRLNKVKEKERVSNDVKVLARLQVAKNDSETFHTHIAIITKKEHGILSYYFINYNSKLPINNLFGGECSTYFLDKSHAKIIIDVIRTCEFYKDYHLNPYTALIIGCLHSGLDLVKGGYLKV